MAVARIQLGSILGAARCCLNNRSHSPARISGGQLVTGAHKTGAMSTRYVGVLLHLVQPYPIITLPHD